MIRQIVLMTLLLYSFDPLMAQDISQDSQYQSEFTFTPDKSLKSIIKYNIVKSDSTKVSRWFYSSGKLMKIINNDKTTTKFLYKSKYSVRSTKDNILINYLFDQNGNLYYQRTMINKNLKEEKNSTPIFEFRNYVYSDSMKIFCNYVKSLSKYTQERIEKYEYDSNKNLIKVYVNYGSDGPDNFRLAKKLFYNSEGLLIKTLGNPFDQLAGGEDSTIYTYDYKNQLTKEVSNNLLEKRIIKYFYNLEGLLKKVTIISSYHEDGKYNHYYLFEY